jgi:hypothetical protein
MRAIAFAAVLLLGSAHVAGASEEPTWNQADSELAIHWAAETYGVSEARLLRVATCESRLDPYAVGDSGHSWGLAQLNDRRTGLLGHFYAQGYMSALDPYEAADYLGRVFSGEFAGEGIGAWRWSCR